MTAAFEYAFARTIGHEGGYSNNPADRGGATKYGVTAATWAAYRAEVRPLDRREVDQITLDDAKAVYAHGWWQPLGLDYIDDSRVSAEIFDTAVNCGARDAVEWAQRAVNVTCRGICAKVKVDGRMGPITRQAVNAVGRKRPSVLLRVMNILQGAHYVALAEGDTTQEAFLGGWLERAQGPAVNL